MFSRTTAVNKILNMTARKRVIQGSTSAGKTYAIIPILIDRALKEGRLKITVVAETLPAVKDGALDIFFNVMQDTNRWIDINWNASSLTYTFGNKSKIQFKAFDTEGKAKASGKRDILFLNEADNIPFDIADALMIRSKETYIDYNPSIEFWVDTETLKEPNSEFLLLTYKDNEAIPKETLEDLLIKKSKAFYDVSLPDDDLFRDGNIKSDYWANWWKVYGLGRRGSVQGTIYTNWSQIDTIPSEARLIYNGLDFGYSVDPSVAVSIYKYNDSYIVDELFYRKGLSNSEIFNLLKGSNVLTVCDSAEPKSIAELQSYGLKCTGAEKGKDSVNFGIQLIQQQNLLITKRSVNLIKELRGYVWETDKSGKETGNPIDAFNHGLDAMRYAFTKVIGSPNYGKYSIG